MSCTQKVKRTGKNVRCAAQTFKVYDEDFLAELEAGRDEIHQFGTIKFMKLFPEGPQEDSTPSCLSEMEA